MSVVSKKKHWSSELITIFGFWLWKKGEYGHALLCIHGPQWGYKIGNQLKITWEDVLHDDDHTPKIDVWPNAEDEEVRPIIGLAKSYIEKANEVIDFENWEDFIYTNSRTGKPLTTSTLNRELKRFSGKFINEMEDTLGVGLELKELKSNAFQIAWAIKTVQRYYYSKKCFVEVSKFMGHRTLKDTISLLEIEPNDNITFDFSGVFNNGKLDSSILDNTSMLKHYAGYAMNLQSEILKSLHS